MLEKEYERLGKPLSKEGATVMGLIKNVEIELSKNSTFTVMKLSILHANPYSWLWWTQHIGNMRHNITYMWAVDIKTDLTFIDRWWGEGAWGWLDYKSLNDDPNKNQTQKIWITHISHQSVSE